MVNNLLSFESLSLDEQNAVTELKKRMVNCMSDEMYSDLSMFVRFLRARNLNVNAAEVMLTNHLEWRKNNQVDTILTDYTPKEVVQKYVTFNNLGLDRDGSPIIFFNVGRVDSRGILKSCRKIDLIKFSIQMLEKNIQTMKEQSIKLNKPVDKWTMLFNAKDLPLSLATHKDALDVISQLISMHESNYPERLKIAILINGSMYFSLAYSIVKHFISPLTRQKIRIFGDDGWLEDVLSVIPEDVLPAFLGGQRTDPDGNPACKTIITYGNFVDQSYYFNKREHSIANLPNVRKLTVTRMSKTQLPFHVTEPDTYIEWEIETKSRDIGFSLLYKQYENDSDMQELIPRQRIDTHMSSEIGTIKCNKAGTYVIEFDNSFSWIFTKEVYYRVSLVKK